LCEKGQGLHTISAPGYIHALLYFCGRARRPDSGSIDRSRGGLVDDEWIRRRKLLKAEGLAKPNPSQK